MDTHVSLNRIKYHLFDKDPPLNSVSANVNAYIGPMISGSAVDGQVYKLKQFHVHWHGNDSQSGTEHALDGKKHAAEVIHHNNASADDILWMMSNV